MPRCAAFLIWFLLAAGCGGSGSPPPAPPAARAVPAPAGAVNRPLVPGVDESGDRALAGAASPLAPALDRYDRGDYAGAAMLFADRLTDEDPVATYFFAKSICHLGYPTASVHWFTLCVTRGHPYRTQALRWLTTFTTAEPLAVVLLHGDEVAAVAAEITDPGITAHLDYLIGRSEYDREELDAAMARLRRVPAASEWSSRALYLLATAEARLERTDAARSHFELVAASRGSDADQERIRDLARLQLARLAYAAASDPAGWQRAIAAYDRVDPAGPNRYDVALERAWARFRLGQLERLLEELDQLEPPALIEQPEAVLLRALALHDLCRLDAADRLLADFMTDAGRIAVAIGHFVSDRDPLDLAAQVRGPIEPPELATLVQYHLARRDVTRRLDLSSAMTGELARLDRAPPGFRASAAGSEIHDALTLLASLTDNEVGGLLARRLNRHRDDLIDLVGKAQSVQFDIARLRADPAGCQPPAR